jgi:C-terminal processing protease CtpA/Prc
VKQEMEWVNLRRNTSCTRFRTQFFSFVVFVLLVGICAGCGGAPAGGGITPPTGGAVFDPGAQFDSLWNNFDQNYSYFVYKNIDWNALNATYRPMALQTTDEASLVAVLTQMLAQLHDQHVKFTDPSGNQLATFVPTVFDNWNQSVWQQYMAAGNFVQVQPGLVTATISGAHYIAVGSWNDAQIDITHLDSVIDASQSASSLIIDVRMNGGGDEQIAYQFAGRFTTQTRTPTGFFQFRNGPLHTDFGPLTADTITPRGSFQFTKPVYLLTGRISASSTEDFISAMRELPNVTVIGDTSAGASGNPLSFTLGGGWSYTVSHWIDYTAEQQIIEDQGIAPAMFVPVTPSDFQQGKDPVIDFAVAEANGTPSANNVRERSTMYRAFASPPPLFSPKR